MEQRTPRLGATVDDYCPRERRLTNHVVVAIVEDAIRQTRCTTCDVEHVYKEGREPRRRKKDDADQGLADATNGQLVAPRPAPAPEPAPQPVVHAAPRVETPHVTPRAAQPEPEFVVIDDGPSLHRRLIRASLPKTEGDVPPPRAIPEFTMHQRMYGRGNGGRPGQGFGGGNPQGRFRQGQGAGNGNGNVPGPSGNNNNNSEIDGNTWNPQRAERRHHHPHGGQPGPGGHGGGGGRRRRGGRHKHPR